MFFSESVEFLDEYFHHFTYDNNDFALETDVSTVIQEEIPNRFVQYFYILWRVMLAAFIFLMCMFSSTLIDKIKESWERIVKDRDDEIKKLQRDNHTLRVYSQSQVLKYKQQARNIQDRLGSMFTTDQMDMLNKSISHPRQWSDETILKSLRMKFACNTKGYNHLLRENYPFPTDRTLRNRLQGLNFAPGILKDVFVFLTLI